MTLILTLTVDEHDGLAGEVADAPVAVVHHVPLPAAIRALLQHLQSQHEKCNTNMGNAVGELIRLLTQGCLRVEHLGSVW